VPDVALVTPSHRHDLARCELLCESVDRHVTGHVEHHVLVPPDDVARFAHLTVGSRTVRSNRPFLPRWLHPLPSVVRYRDRSIAWCRHARPLTGWHTQQLVKLAAATTLGHEVVVNLDSDVVFLRDFDVAGFAVAPSPLPCVPLAITADHADHVRWLTTAHRLLGLDTPAVPAADYIDTVVVWRAGTVRGLLARVEACTGLPWAVALTRARAFSEYLLYGVHVGSDEAAGRDHRPTPDSFTRSHWDPVALDAEGIAALVDRMLPHEVALHVQSFSRTPVELVRAAAGL
jgi:hypothetical protein